MIKTCTECKVAKDDSEFHKKKFESGNYGLKSTCKLCASEKRKSKYANETEEQRIKRKAKVKEWREGNRDKVNALKNKYRLQDKAERISLIKHEAHIIWRDKYLNKISSKKYDRHVTEWKSNGTIYTRWQSNHDMSYVIYQRLKRGVHRALKYIDDSNWLSVLGYTAKELKEHIESQFVYGMSWDNRHEWHMDHINPLCMYEFSSVHSKEFKECFALDNLRPLWADHNRIKYMTHDIYLKSARIIHGASLSF